MTTETLIVVLLIVLIVGAVPTWPYSRSWGYGPSGLLVVLLVVAFIWAANGGHVNRSSGDRLSSDMQKVGDDMRDVGQKTADSLRNVVR